MPLPATGHAVYDAEGETYLAIQLLEVDDECIEVRAVVFRFVWGSIWKADSPPVLGKVQGSGRWRRLRGSRDRSG